MWNLILLGAVALTAAQVDTVATFAASYDCKSVTHANIGWNAAKRRYTAEAHEKISNPSIVKLSGLRDNEPTLTGQQVTRLYKLSDSAEAVWFAERAPAGTIIQWTLFEKNSTTGPGQAILFSMKSYDFMGPQSFTDIYECTPNSSLPSQR